MNLARRISRRLPVADLLSHRSRGTLNAALFLALATVMMAVAAWLVGGFAADVRSQEKYSRGYGVQISLWESSEDYPPFVEYIVDNRMLEKRDEPAEVQKSKNLLQGVVDSFYFDSIWGIFNFLALIQDKGSIRTTMDFALKEGLLNISKDCINFSQCERRESSNLTSRNASELAAFLGDFYVKSADELLQNGEFASAQSMFAQMLGVLRRVDTPLSDPSNHELSSLYVRGIFSLLIDPAQHESSQIQLRILDDFLDSDSTTLTGNRYIDAYIGGVQYLRNGCYTNAYKHFSAMLDHTSFDYLEELYSFLAVRSYFSGLLDRNALRIDPDKKKIFFLDCNSWLEVGEFSNEFPLLRSRTMHNIKHPGFISDIAEYMSHLPGGPVEYETLYLQISGTAKRVSNSPENGTVFKPITRESVSVDVDPSSMKPDSGGIKRDYIVESRKATSTHRLLWPVRGRIISSFGRVAGESNDGIDIAVPQGTPVKAAEDGVVIYAGDGLKEFGKTVLVRHDGGLVTVYGHTSELKVARGEKVKRGQLIAISGKSGITDTPKLHFEVRVDSAPADPAIFLDVLVDQTLDAEESASTTPSGLQGCAALALIKEGLNAFGYGHLDADCDLNRETTQALVEFKKLFGISEDSRLELVLAKMKEIGLTP